MANDYTDNFAGEPYFISKGEPLSAAGMTAALNTREKVANKATSLSSASTDDEYPSAKAVYESAIHKTGNETITGVKTFGKTGEAAEPKLGAAKTTDAANDGTKFATEAQVYNLAQQLANVLLPKGMILAMNASSWLNAGAVFQSNWKVCDGTGGTPDLRGRFLRGGTASDSPTGGGKMTLAKEHLPSHGHSASISGGSHEHRFIFDHNPQNIGQSCAGVYGGTDKYLSGANAMGLFETGMASPRNIAT
ncbi:MAG: hypothetical protein LBJ25_05050, partial [Candidatus Margulisbacteria bacterium]|nr:hypothetical protein [Candidatus Margulisiibacteriota bacterium]